MEARTNDESFLIAQLSNTTFTDSLFANFPTTVRPSLSEDLSFTVTGTTPISGHYTSKQTYMDKVLDPLFSRIAGDFPSPTIENMLVDSQPVGGEGSQQLWCAVHFRTEDVRGKNGCDFSMRYCWLIRVEEARVIREIVGFYDSAKVTALFE